MEEHGAISAARQAQRHAILGWAGFDVLADGTLHGDETSTHRPFGEGFIDFAGLAPKLLEVPKIEWWCIDMCFWAGSWELVEPSLKFVRNLLAAQTVVA